MSKILFGAHDGNQAFTAHDVIRAKLSNTADDAVEDLNNKIDWLVEKIDNQDPCRGELLRACPTIVIANGDAGAGTTITSHSKDVVATLDNPIYEHFTGLDVTAVDSAPAERQQPKTSTKQPKKASANKSKAERSSGSKSKKDLARDIFHKMEGERRKDVIEAMCTELGFSKAHASTYYQAIKKEL